MQEGAFDFWEDPSIKAQKAQYENASQNADLPPEVG